MNSKERCRTCLCSNKEMRNIHTAITIAGESVKLSDILQNFYNYKVSHENDSFPDKLCINCVTQLTLTYSFKILIENSYKTLTENYNSSFLFSDNNYDNSFESDDVKPIISFQTKRKLKVKTELKPQREVDVKPIISLQTKRKLKVKTELKPQREVLFCVVCKIQFDSKQSLSEHCSETHTYVQEVGKKCDYCEEKFEDFRSLVIHRKLHITPYLCENCWDGFLTTEELNNHLCQPKSKVTERVKPGQVIQQCDQCGKSYPNGYMRVHMMIHGNDLKYSCKYCPKRFKVPGSLNSHILWNHKRTRDHKCDVCNATFISASSRSTHIRKHHLKEKKYGCESCSKRFFSKSELERHMLTHTGVKNFHCQLCDKSYQTRYGLNVHLKSHSLSENVMNM